MDKMKVWFAACRPFSFTATIISILLGTVLALIELKSIDFYLFAIVLVGVFLLHSGTNLINDYYDYKNGVDNKDHPGGSGVVPGEVLSAREIKWAALFCFGLACILAVYLIYRSGIIIAVIFGIGLAGGYFYTAEPINYKYHALGVPVVFILLGPILVGVTYYIQTANYNLRVFLISLPLALLVSAILHSNDLRDLEHDAESGVKTLANILQDKLAVQFYFLLLGLAYLLIVYLVLSKQLPLWSLITLVTLPQAVNNIVNLFADQTIARQQIEKLERRTAKLHFKFGMLLVLSLLGANFL